MSSPSLYELLCTQSCTLAFFCFPNESLLSINCFMVTIYLIVGWLISKLKILYTGIF